MKIFKALLIIIFPLIIYSNYIIWNSYVIQTSAITDFNTRTYNSDTYQKLMVLNINFPNLSATSFPMYGLLAMYHIAFEQYSDALETLNNNKDSNPFLRVKESLKADVFHTLGLRDSAFYYSKIAHENLPKNTRHYQQYLTELVNQKEIDTIKKIFNESNAKRNPQYWTIFLSSVINIRDKNDKEIDSIAIEALRKFKGNSEIKAIASFILYGQENVIKAAELFDEGIMLFENNNFNEASKKFIEASILNPLDYKYFENAGMSLIKAADFNGAIPYFEKVIFSKEIDRPNDGKSEFGIGLCYKEIGENELACKFLNESMKMNYRAAFNIFSSNCN